MSLLVLLSLAAGGCFSLLAIVYKTAERRQCRAIPFAFAFVLVAGTLALLSNGFQTSAWSAAPLWVLGIAMGCMHAGGIILINQVNRLGPAYISWTVINLSLLLPILASAILLQEHLVKLDAFVLLLFVIMLLLFNVGMRGLQHGGKRLSPRFALFLVCLWTLNGLFLFGNKLKYSYFGDNFSAELALIFYWAGGLAIVLLSLVLHQPFWPNRSERSVGFAAGFVSVAGLLMMQKAMSLPSAMVFPLIQGMSLVGGVVLTQLVFRESVNRYTLLGISCGVAILLLAVWREQLMF
ncbi:MAG TPA: hypothetical protein PKN04_10805 [bacterium]|nr:hypothetical protein [bacterium]HNT66258.1 hypothetical protein [bacterium]HOX86795.1 hypothetical protein [bacterium]HPG46950.1 hypothetical protein [bacterium]HPM99314.1 hypothetical protein [bacterium]